VTDDPQLVANSPTGKGEEELFWPGEGGGTVEFVEDSQSQSTAPYHFTIFYFVMASRVHAGDSYAGTV